MAGAAEDPAGHIDPTRESLAALAGLPDDDPVVMLNLLRFRDAASYPDGSPHPPCTGREAYRRYGTVAIRHVRAVGGDQIFGGSARCSIIGPADEWDEVLLVRYPSPAAFLTMVADPDYRAAAVHRSAALADSRLIALRPHDAVFASSRAAR